MSPEELDKIRTLVDKNFRAGTYQKTISRDELLYLGGWAGGLLDLIDQQAAQIAALKEIAIQERAKQHTGELFWHDTPLLWQLRYKADARKQLEAEHPEAFR